MMNKKWNKALLVASILTGMTVASAIDIDAANLMVTIPSDYGSSTMGVIKGSRVTSTVNGTPIRARKGLNGDPGVFNINMDGQSKIFLRQYTYSDSKLLGNEILDAEGDWNSAEASGLFTTTVNPHGVVAKGNTIYATGYDKGTISIGTVSGSTLTEDTNKTVKLLDDIKKTGETSLSEYTDNVGAHGEGIIIRGNDLYVQASVNKDGTYYNYDDGFLLHYVIKSDGSLFHGAKDFVRIGKNTDQSRINLYNDHIFISAIGGPQNYGEGNSETSITAASINSDGSLEKEHGHTISVPDSVKKLGQDFRDLKILPNGTAYVMTFNLSANSGIDMTIYQTTVSNLYTRNPKDWTVVHSGNYDGWFGKLNAEMYTHRLWIEAGQKLLAFTDGDTSPKYTWAATDFGDAGLYQYNFMAMLQPDTVYGNEATLTAIKAEGLTTPSVSVTASINQDAVFITDTDSIDNKTKISGSSEDTTYKKDGVTSDYKTYSFDDDYVISVDKSKYLTGDLITNVLAAVDAHAGNDVTIDASSNTLQLQASHTIGSPSGIYAGNKKNVTVTAGKLNIITKGMTGGNSITNGIWLDAPASGSSSITIHALTTNIAMTGGYGGNGIAIQKTDRWGEASDAASGVNKITLRECA